MRDASPEAVLRARYPLPEWAADSEFKRELTLAIAQTLATATEHWPDLPGATGQMDYARHVTRTVQARLKPLLAWLDEYPTDGYSFPGDTLVAYISQLALTRPGEPDDTDRYRELLRAYGHYLARIADETHAGPMR